MDQLGKFNSVLLVNDFDDTLYGEDMRITQENMEALTYFIREGGTFTVATDHARPNFTPHTSHVPIDAPVILSNGFALYDFWTGEMIYEAFLSDQVREDLQQMAQAIPTIGFEAHHHDAVYVYQSNIVIQHHLERAGMTAREVLVADIPLPWSKVILQRDYETSLHTQRYLLKRQREHYKVILFNRVLLELTREGSSKDGMMQYLARHLGIDAQHIYCVGDNQSDTPMLTVPAIPSAPADCTPEVKQWGARILGTCQESCVAQTVDVLDRIYA